MMDWKPENGCKIQNVCNGESCIMLCLLFVKSSNSKTQCKEGSIDEKSALNYGTKVLKYLCAPWAYTNHVVYSNLAFVSRQSAAELFKMGLHFLDVVKIATKGFPMEALKT